MHFKKFFTILVLTIALISGTSIYANARVIDLDTVKPTKPNKFYTNLDDSCVSSSPVYVQFVFADVKTNGARLTVRKGPGKEFKNIGSLANKERVTILGSDGADWSFVRYSVDNSSDCKVGWVSKDYLKYMYD